MKRADYVKLFNKCSLDNEEIDFVELIYLVCCDVMQNKIMNSSESLELKDLNIRGFELYLREDKELAKAVLEFIAGDVIDFCDGRDGYLDYSTRMKAEVWLKEHVDDVQFINKKGEIDSKLLGDACGKALGIITNAFLQVHPEVYICARQVINNKPKCKIVNKEGKEFKFSIPESPSKEEISEMLTKIINHLGL